MTETVGSGHPLDLLYPDPANIPPLCGEEEFAAELARMVADDAPRLFAVVQEYGEHVDACIAAWGMAFDDHAVVASGGAWMSLRAPENALRRFKRGSHVHARLVWVSPEAATPPGNDDSGLERSELE